MSKIDDLISKIEDVELRNRIYDEVRKLKKQKKFGLVYEEHLPEATILYDVPVKRGASIVRRDGDINEVYCVTNITGDVAHCMRMDATKEVSIFNLNDIVVVAQFGKPIYPFVKKMDSVCNAPDSDLWHMLIEADNYHALQLLVYLYGGKVDCIYIDPPYNTGAKDWKYNNDYVDGNDAYRHSKWLSFMEHRLNLAKQLLNPKDSVLIVTIDEKEYLNLGCLLKQMFSEAQVQMICDVINPRGTNRENEFSRVEEYIYICRFGDASINKTNNNMLGNTDETGKARVWYAFNRGNNPQSSAPRQFFPIYINEKTKEIVEVGTSLLIDTPIEDYPTIDGLVAVFPINKEGNHSIWRAIPETTKEWVKKGYVKVSTYEKKNQRWTLSYIPSGLQERIESGEIKATKKLASGVLDISHIEADNEKVSPRTVWYQKLHNATDYGASIIKSIIPNHSFSYPKSLYAVHDTINFFVANKPNALILDFFAGSGTTLHAVNLLNAEDGGNRRCIMVTNNEVSNEEAKKLSEQGYRQGDEEWEKLGIARYVTWPRTVCSIKGKDINGKLLKGSYLGSDIPMADGFKSNAIFFKLGFLDKTEVAFGRNLKELIPLLWMKANAIGECPNMEFDTTPDMIILPENKMAILVEEDAYPKFKDEVSNVDIETVFIITDSEDGYREMTSRLNVKQTYQLYRDYLDNFTINK